MSGLVFVEIEFKTDKEKEAIEYLNKWKKDKIIVNYGFIHPNMSGGHCMD